MQIILDDFATNHENMQEPLWLLEHVNKLFQLAMVGIKVLFPISHRKHTKSNGKILVAGKNSTIGVGGPGENPSWGETRLSGTGSSRPGQESGSLSLRR